MFVKNYAAQAALHLTLIGNEQNVPKVVVVEFQAVKKAEGPISDFALNSVRRK
jgi:hypothetical protein